MNKSCNLIYFAGLILINCSNAADGYKPLPDPVYKNLPVSDYSAQPLLQQAWSRQTPQTKSLRPSKALRHAVSRIIEFNQNPLYSDHSRLLRSSFADILNHADNAR